MDGTNERKLIDGADLASWSPDGSRIAYVAYIDGRGTGLGVAEADGSNAHVLLRGTTSIFQPMWSPDGSRLAYLESPNAANGSLKSCERAAPIPGFWPPASPATRNGRRTAP